MKIIQIMPEFGLAGAEIMCENLVYELKKMGNEIMIISLYNYHSAITERLEKSGIKIKYLDKKPGLDFSIFFKLFKIFYKEKPDVIHTHRYVMQYVIPIAVLTKIKNRVHTIHNIAEKEVGYSARKLSKIFYKYFSVIPVALSEAIQKTIINEYGIKKRNVPVIFNGINLEKCILKINYSSDQTFSILHIGRFSEAKNHFELLKAFKIFNDKYPNSVLNLIGDGELKEKIEDYVKNNHLEKFVKFLGLQSNVYPFLNKADIFTLPSKYEGIPMTLIEAMATGLPIVATEVGGIPDMLKNNESALITKVNVEEVAEAFEKLFLNEELRKKLGKNALKESMRFTSKEMAKKYIFVYQKNYNKE